MSYVRLPLPLALVLACAQLPACSPSSDEPPPMATLDMSPAVRCTADEPTANPRSPYAKDLYLRGTMNSWAADAGYVFRATGHNVLTLGVQIPKDTHSFKIADKDWSAELNFGGSDTNLVQLGMRTTLRNSGGNLALGIPRDGLYCFKVNAQDPQNPTVTVTLLKELEFKEGIELTRARAYFLSSAAIAWKTMGAAASFSYFLYHDPAGKILAKDGTLVGGQAIPLSYAGLVSENNQLVTAFPYLAKYAKLGVSGLQNQLPELLREQLVLVVKSTDGSIRAATSLQTFGVIDELLTYSGDDLGVSFDELGNPVLKLWAPTAKAVKLLLYDTAAAALPAQTINVTHGDNGVWTAKGDPTTKRRR